MFLERNNWINYDHRVGVTGVFYVFIAGNISAYKAIMKLAGFDVGPVRPALTNIDGEEAEELINSLTQMGFQQWIE